MERLPDGQLQMTRYHESLIDRALYKLYVGQAIHPVMGTELRRRGLADYTPPQLTDMGRRLMVDRINRHITDGTPIPGARDDHS